jgi:hypothetical protein
MNVLEIYPNWSWWFEARTVEEIERLRVVAQAPSNEAQSASFEKLAPTRAFHLVGDAATFDLIPGVFDEVIVHYSPNLLKRLILESRIKTWIQPAGVCRFQPDFEESNDPQHTNDEGLRPVWMVR